ncbi:MAG: carbohydrate ABC transporter permease, partial [Oscillospiraceae bacterium]|nr:carbohydrate ABC transporter permease [Oscillospiraceae bacterium]
MKKKRYFSRGALFILALLFAAGFVLPTLLTVTNSFMTESELNANYGQVFSSTASSGSTTYLSESVTLKFIPDKVSFSQYITGR